MQLSDRHWNWASDVFPSFFVPNNLLNSHIAALLENYCACQQSAHCGLPEIKIPVCWFQGICSEHGLVKSEVWGPEVSASLGRSGMKAALVLPKNPIQSAPCRGQSQGGSSLRTELPLLGALFAFKLWLFFVSGQIYCRGMLASLLALNSVVLTSLLS